MHAALAFEIAVQRHGVVGVGLHALVNIDIAVPNALKVPFKRGGDGKGLFERLWISSHKAQLDAAVHRHHSALRHKMRQSKGRFGLKGEAASGVAL